MENISIKLYRTMDEFSDIFWKKSFMTQDFMYTDFEIMDKMNEIHHIFNKYTYK